MRKYYIWIEIKNIWHRLPREFLSYRNAYIVAMEITSKCEAPTDIRLEGEKK